MIQGSITLGPFAIPSLLLLILAASAAGHITVLLLYGKERTKEASDRLFTLLLVYTGVWRLSLFLTHSDALKGSLSALLVLPGGRINHIMAASALFLTLAVMTIGKKMDRRQLLTFSMLCAAIFFSYALLYLPARRFIPEPAQPDNVQKIRITTVDGREEDLMIDGARATVINFWASWCPPCRAEIPELRRWWRLQDREELRFYALNMTGSEKSPRELQDFIREEARELPVYLDGAGRAASAFNISALPTTMVFNREGELVASRTGAVDLPWLEGAVKKTEQQEIGSSR